MFASTQQTLIYLGHDRIVRCDVARSGEARGFATQSRPIGVELPTLVEMALRLRDAKPGRVWVLSADFWTQRVSLSTSATRSLTPAEVGRALAFEIESLSGLSALDSDVGYQVVSSTPTEREYWVVQVPVWFREQTDSVVREAGGRLAGLVHPGGVPYPLTVKAARWLRVESWPGAIISVGSAGNRPEYAISQPDARAAWRSEVDALAARIGGVDLHEQLADHSVALPLERAIATVRLDSDDAIAAWLAAWGSALAATSPAVPVLRPVKRPIPKSSFGVAALVAAAVVIAIAGFDAWRVYGAIAEAKAKTAALHERTTQQAHLKTQATAADKHIVESRSVRDKVKKEVVAAERTLSAFRRRWPELLTALAEHCPGDVVVREITLEGTTGAAIHGWSLDSASCNQLAATLASQLRSAGWSVSPAKKTVVASSDGREVCRFVVELKPAVLIPHATEEQTQGVVTQR